MTTTILLSVSMDLTITGEWIHTIFSLTRLAYLS